MINKSIPKVVITQGYLWDYFEWFILGFYMLQSKGVIDFEFQLNKRPLDMALTRIKSPFVARIVNHIRCNNREDMTFTMDGYICYDDTRYPFTIDCQDAPFLFDEEKLRDGYIYFKMQYPDDIEQDSFELAPGVQIPWCDHKHKDPSIKIITDRAPRKEIRSLKPYLESIKPLMIGPRRLSRGFSQQLLEQGYSNYINSRKLKKQHKIMCYFGNSKGPVPENFYGHDYVYLRNHIDYDWERDLMGAFADKISHPNEKRG